MQPNTLLKVQELLGRALTDGEVATLDAQWSGENRNDTEITRLLSGMRVMDSREVEAWRAKKLLIKRGKWRGIAEAAANPAHPATDAAYAAVALAEAASMMVDFNDVVSRALLGQMVEEGLITQEIKDELYALSATTSPFSLSEVSRVLNIAEGRMSL